MAVKQCAYDSAINDAWERLVLAFELQCGRKAVLNPEALQMQPIFCSWAYNMKHDSVGLPRAALQKAAWPEPARSSGAQSIPREVHFASLNANALQSISPAF